MGGSLTSVGLFFTPQLYPNQSIMKKESPEFWGALWGSSIGCGVIATLVLLTSCKVNDRFASRFITDSANTSCVAGYVEDTPGKGTIDIYTETIGIESISGVTIKIAEEITQSIGNC